MYVCCQYLGRGKEKERRRTQKEVGRKEKEGRRDQKT
jgi:hypothetical protein